jgi:hypothetical protein
MKRLATITALALLAALPAFAQARHAAPQGFASDFQTVPVMGNTPGANGANFQTYVALLNPTASSFVIDATLWDASGQKHTATIPLAAGELKTYQNFLGTVFNFQGGGAVTFQAPQSVGGTHNNRFIVDTEVYTTGTHYGTSVPSLEFAGSSSRSFSPGVTMDSTARTNIGCFDQSGNGNTVKATLYDASHNVVSTLTLNLAPNAWGQAPVSGVVSNGYVQFDPTDAAVCYASVVNNTSNDAKIVVATEYQP